MEVEIIVTINKNKEGLVAREINENMGVIKSGHLLMLSKPIFALKGPKLKPAAIEYKNNPREIGVIVETKKESLVAKNEWIAEGPKIEHIK